jgi:hypothetical protein
VLGIFIGLAFTAIFGAFAEAAWFPVTIAYPLIPLSIGVAVMRYRLYEIDRIVSRTISWAITTGSIMVVFVVLVVGIQALVAPLTKENTLAVAASTLVAFALFQPLRRRVQSAVDRRFSRSRYDAERIVGALSTSLRDGVDLSQIEEGVVTTAVRTFRPTGAAIWIRPR